MKEVFASRWGEMEGVGRVVGARKWEEERASEPGITGGGSGLNSSLEERRENKQTNERIGWSMD